MYYYAFALKIHVRSREENIKVNSRDVSVKYKLKQLRILAGFQNVIKNFN